MFIDGKIANLVLALLSLENNATDAHQFKPERKQIQETLNQKELLSKLSGFRSTEIVIIDSSIIPNIDSASFFIYYISSRIICFLLS